MDPLDLLIDLHLPNPRQGPGGDAQSDLALRLTGLDPAAPLTVADIGCGTGAATLALAGSCRRRTSPRWISWPRS